MTIIEQQSRALKASALVAALHESGATSASVTHLDDACWRTAAQAAGVRPPSPTTRALVARWFVEREQPVDDPFADLDDAA
jgi:hypothetical protein